MPRTEKQVERAGDRGRPARRSRGRGQRRSRAGKADFIALGRTLIADPRMGGETRAGEPTGAALPATPASTTCAAARTSAVSSMARPAARHIFADAAAAARRAHRGDRRRPGRSHLCVAGRRRQQRSRCSRTRAAPGGAFRYAGKAPLFQEVEANQQSFRTLHRRSGRGLRDARASCSALATDVDALPGLLAPFDRIVVATGADYRFGSAASPTGCSIAAWRARRAWRGCSPGRRCATGSTIARAAPPARASAI